MENESTRQSAVEAILERNPNAFRPKIQAGAAVSSAQLLVNLLLQSSASLYSSTGELGFERCISTLEL